MVEENSAPIWDIEAVNWRISTRRSCKILVISGNLCASSSAGCRMIRKPRARISRKTSTARKAEMALGMPSLVRPLVSGSSNNVITIAANSGRKKTAPADKAKGRARNRPSDSRKIVVENSRFMVVFEPTSPMSADGASASDGTVIGSLANIWCACLCECFAACNASRGSQRIAKFHCDCGLQGIALRFFAFPHFALLPRLR